MSVATPTREEVYEAIGRLIDEYRLQCLWFAPKDYNPTSDEGRLRALENIERYADREGFKRARQLREWLSQPSKSP